MPKALTLGLSLHCAVSFFLVFLGVVRLLLTSPALGLLAGAIGLGLGLGLFRLALPYWAKTGQRRDFVVAESLASACVANYVSFLVVVGFGRKFDLPTDWLPMALGFGSCFGLMPWAVWQLILFWQDKEVSNHGAAVTESRRLLELDAPKDAEDKLKESLLQAEVIFGSQHLHAAQAAIDLARFYAETEQRKQAAAMFQRALKIREKLLGDEDVRVSSALMEWVSADDSLDPNEAIAQMRKALLILEKQLGAYAPPVALAYERVGELQQIQGQFGEAENALRRSFSILKKSESQTHRDQFRVGLKLSRCYLEMGKPNEALEVIQSLEPLTSTQRPLLQLESLMVQMTLYTDLVDQQTSSDKAWAALKLLQRELGPQASEFKSIWEGCLDRLTEPYANPEVKALFSAILGGETFTIKKILGEHNEWVTQQDATGWTLIQWACFFGHERLIETLSSLGASVDDASDEWPPLQIACRWGHRRLISLLATKIASQNQVAAHGWHAVHRCAQNGDIRLMELLTAKDLEVDCINERGDTPLLIAVRNGHYLFTVGMVSRGADINKVNSQSGRTPLHEAAYIGHRAIAECLMLNGSKLDARDRAGLTPAELALQADKESMVKQIQVFAKGHKA
ncbi:ankyrin repeat domain-containing protein [bacterium]|nr:ankyrin repeat domain-containing protein [bacterium]